MESFEPFIGVISLLTVLSVLSERATNLLKLRNARLRVKKIDKGDEKGREYAITGRGVLVGIAVAIIVKADFFAIIGHLEAPWETLGWVHVENYKWMRSAASASPVGALYALSGCVLTGISLGFGSKFWHDILGSIYELRDGARNRNEEKASLIAAAAATKEQKLAGNSR